MKRNRHLRRRSERGIALLIAIFVLLLISVVAIALLVSSGTETALGANYRASSTVYYAALAGLEEARGRLLPRNPSSLVPATMPPGTIMTPNQTIYIVNPSSGETVAPWDRSNVYYDHEYYKEFGVEASSATWQSTPSVWVGNAYPGPLYKWVRINAATEQSIHTDVDNDGTTDPSPTLSYDPAHVDLNGNPWPSLIVSASPPSTAVQALEITALASLPNGSKKVLQYLVAPQAVSLAFPAALTLDGFSDAYAGPNHNFFQIAGQDSSGGCGATMPGLVPAIGVPDASDVNTVIGGIPTSPTNETNNYTGTGPAPSVAQVGLAPNLQTVKGLNQLAQTIIQNADAVIAGPANQANLPSSMSSTNPMTVAIAGDPGVPSQGNFSLTGGFTGYGLLLVTGNFTYTPDSNWNGIVLVIGQGTVATINGSNGGGQFNGAMLIAKTLDSSGNLLPGPNPGSATFNDSTTSFVGRGYFYNCSWIQAAEAPLTYKVLSFHEIPQ